MLIIHPFSACWFKGRVLALKARGAGKKSKVKGKKGVSGAKPSKAIPASPLSIAYLEWIVCIFPGFFDVLRKTASFFGKKHFPGVWG